MNQRRYKPLYFNMNSEIIFYAFRYALGRKTYAVSDVVSYIIEHWHEINIRERSAMKKEIEKAIYSDHAGMDIDVEEWKKILELQDDFISPVIEENIYIRALRESLKLQAHYARLLNDWDGGRRHIFKSVGEWLRKLELISSTEEKLNN